MNCPTCNKPTPPDSVHTCSPVPLLTAEQASEFFIRGALPTTGAVGGLDAIASGRVACYDTATHKAVPLMTEAEAREKFDRWWFSTNGRAGPLECYLAALRDLGVLRD